jgi:hypothetical protein
MGLHGSAKQGVFSVRRAAKISKSAVTVGTGQVDDSVGITLSAVRSFSGEMRQALTLVSAQQLEALQTANGRLLDFAQDLATVRNPKRALAIQCEIINCLADAADSNVWIWSELAIRVRAACACGCLDGETADAASHPGPGMT